MLESLTPEQARKLTRDFLPRAGETGGGSRGSPRCPQRGSRVSPAVRREPGRRVMFGSDASAEGCSGRRQQTTCREPGSLRRMP